MTIEINIIDEIENNPMKDSDIVKMIRILCSKGDLQALRALGRTIPRGLRGLPGRERHGMEITRPTHRMNPIRAVLP
jgi:hypothetical protein